MIKRVKIATLFLVGNLFAGSQFIRPFQRLKESALRPLNASKPYVFRFNKWHFLIKKSLQDGEFLEKPEKYSPKPIDIKKLLKRRLSRLSKQEFNSHVSELLGKINIENNDCLSYIVNFFNQEHLKNRLIKIGLLNMANAYDIGGGYNKGCITQEEDIVYRTTFYLYFKILEKLYPIRGELECIYVPSVKILRKSALNNFDLLPEKSRTTINLINAAAFDFRKTDVKNKYCTKGVLQYNQEGYVTMVLKVAGLFELAKKEGITDLVLGAWGCGAFKNPPAQVAEIMLHLAVIYAKDFNRIHFPIYYPGSGPKANLDTFMNQKNKIGTDSLNNFKTKLKTFGFFKDIKKRQTNPTVEARFAASRTNALAPLTQRGLIESRSTPNVYETIPQAGQVIINKTSPINNLPFSQKRFH